VVTTFALEYHMGSGAVFTVEEEEEEEEEELSGGGGGGGEDCDTFNLQKKTSSFYERVQEESGV